MRKIFKKILPFVAFSFFLGVSQNLWAQAPGQDAGALLVAIKNLVGGYGLDQYLKPDPKDPVKFRPYFLFCNDSQNPPPDAFNCPDNPKINMINVLFIGMLPENMQLVSTPAPNPSYDKKTASAATQVPTMPEQLLYGMITTPSKSAKVPDPHTQLLNLIDDSNLPLIYPATTASTVAILGNPPARTENPVDLSAINMDTLLTPLQFNDQQRKRANTFVKFVTNLVVPMTLIDFDPAAFANVKPAPNMKTLLQKDAVLNYRATLYSLASSYSVALSNFYWLYAERNPVKTQTLLENAKKNQNNLVIPENMPLPPELKENASPLALEQYMVKRRFTDPQWVEQIQTRANTAELQRQMIYLLRDIHYELFQARQTNERVLAALSAMEVLSANGAQINLTTVRQTLCQQPEFANQTICNQKPPMPAGGTFP